MRLLFKNFAGILFPRNNLVKCDLKPLKRDYSNDLFDKLNKPEKPFSLIDKEPFVLPHPLKMFMDQLYRFVRLRLDMRSIDPTFNIQEFNYGTRMAMITVSNRISNGKFDDLKGLVEPSLIDKIKIGYAKLNQEQRNMLATSLNQVTHQRVIDFNVLKKDQSTLVEIMIQFYILNNLEDIKNAFSENVNFKEHLTIHVKNLIIAEYR